MIDTDKAIEKINQSFEKAIEALKQLDKEELDYLEILEDFIMQKLKDSKTEIELDKFYNEVFEKSLALPYKIKKEYEQCLVSKFFKK